ncbi:MAG: restriction endonuclease subunit S [Saprospiraceae bacterium]|nr:restriction endonuclease subunit S [Candidatus Defluviibacterium haderslevense]
MKSNYRRLGDYIQELKVRNTEEKAEQLLGINIDKFFMPSVANVVGTDLSVYKLVRKNQFACNRMHVGRDYRLPISMSKSDEEFMVSPAYDVFEIKDPEVLNPEFLMMWFSRSEFDRNAWFHTDGDVRGGLPWKSFCDMQIPIPNPTKQKEIVKEYNVIQNRIALNQQLIQKLEETAQAIYKAWLVEGIDLENLPEGWRVDKLKNLCEKIGSGSTPNGGKESYFTTGISLIRSTNVFDYNFSFEDLAFISDEQANKLKNVEVKENDILFNITGVSVARCCKVPKNVLPARVNQHVMIIRPNGKLNISFYLLLNLCSTDSKNTLLGISQSGSTREAITKSELEEFLLLVPENELLQKFEKQLSKLFSLKDLKSLENQKLTEMKDLLLSKLATIAN